jgi:hypothetical protein
VLCEGKVLLLSMAWNFPNFDNDYLNYLQYLPEFLQQEYAKGKKNPKIFHLTTKPWRQYIDTHSANIFLRYARKTPFAGDILVEMYDKGLVEPYVPINNRLLSEIDNNNVGVRLLLKSLKYWAKRRFGK